MAAGNHFGIALAKVIPQWHFNFKLINLEYMGMCHVQYPAAGCQTFFGFPACDCKMVK